jgi:hypothetical protein
MSNKYLEYDFDNPAHKRGRRRPPPIMEGEILEPESTPHIRVEVTHHDPRRHQILPQHLIIVAALLFLTVIMIRSPGALLMLAVIGWKFLAAFAILAAILAIVAYREWRRGRPF